MTVINGSKLSKAKNSVLKAGQEMFRSGLVVGTWGNISARIPCADMFVITPSGKNYLELGLADLVVMDLNGNIIEGELKPSSEFHLHQYFYRARPEINAVVHTHSIFASAYAVARTVIPANIEDLAMIVGGDVPVAQYALPGTEELAENAVTAMGERWSVLLANHGVVGVGRTLDEAMTVCQIVEKTAHINLMTKNLGQSYELSQGDIQRLRDAYFVYGQKK
ncbi:MAG TPA: class II aldolase/adducin family protein [Verrucomicrobiae bacterium]|nr:class II aldolase/adducin family protein [Verrucomicrobiae bacterium]